MKWSKIGSVRKSKKGSLYIKFDTDVTLKKDSVLQLQNPRESVEASVKAGRITEEKGQELLTKIPEFIRQDVFLVSEE